MAVDTETLYSVGHAAQRLEAAAYGMSLTNNPAPELEDRYNTEAAATVALLGGTVVPSTSAVVDSGEALVVPVTGTYVTTATPTVVNGVVTAIVLS